MAARTWFSRLNLAGSSGSTVTVTVVVLRAVRNVARGRDIAGVYSRSVRDNGGQHEAGAIGLARGDGEEAGTGTGDLAGAVVTTAVGSGDGSEGRDDGKGLHVDGLNVYGETKSRDISSGLELG